MTKQDSGFRIQDLGRRAWKPLLVLALLCAWSALLIASSTIYTETWTSSLDGWSYTQSSCGGTCADARLTSDGNPADSVHNQITGRSKAETGYWSKKRDVERLNGRRAGLTKRVLIPNPSLNGGNHAKR